MKTIKIKKTKFQKLYNIACNTWQPIFQEKFKDFLFEDYIEFDKSFLLQMKIACTSPQLKVFNTIFKDYLQDDIDLFKINTYEKVCKQLKEKEESCSYKKIKQIEKLFNENWKKDFKNKKQYKHYPYFEMTSSGLVFSGSYFIIFFFSGQVAYFKDQETSDFVGETFRDIYEELLD